MANNCEARKIDSNATGLAYAETICGVLPTLADDGYEPVWFELEPNSYSSFGGELTTMARSPLNASRQRKKGTPVDLDASGGIEHDFLQHSLTRLLQGFFFADLREKADTDPYNGTPIDLTGAVAATDQFQAAGGLTRFRVGQLVHSSGWDNPANNGVFLVTGVAPNAITVSGAIADEAPPATARIQVVGYKLPAAAASLVLVGNRPRLVLAGVPTAATAVLTFNANPGEGDSVEVGGVTYTFAANPVIGESETLLGATAADTAANFTAAVNGDAAGFLANSIVSAANAGDGVTLTARVAGAGANVVPVTIDAADITSSGATLSGGIGNSLLELGLTVGEWVFLGGDTPDSRFAGNIGYARVASVSDNAILFDKTTFEPSANNGVGVGLNVYTGAVLRNEKDPELVVTRYYEFERSLGKDADGVQAEYLTRAVMNEFSLNMPVADKLTADISFVGGDLEQRNGLQGRKPGLFSPALGEDAFNTSSSIVRVRMSLVDPVTSRPLPLFAYITEGSITINNGVTPVKVVGTMGGIDVNVDDFAVGGEVTALFTTVEATRAIRNNADVTLDLISASQNAGFVLDIPLLTLGGGNLDITKGEPVTVALETFGAENPNGYTMLYTNFPYLPAVAMPIQGGEY